MAWRICRPPVICRSGRSIVGVRDLHSSRLLFSRPRPREREELFKRIIRLHLPLPRHPAHRHLPSFFVLPSSHQHHPLKGRKGYILHD